MTPGEKQTAFAARIGVSQPGLNDWLKKKVAPRRMSLEVVGQKLDVDPEWLRTGRGEKRPYPVREPGRRQQEMHENFMFAVHLDGIAEVRDRYDPLVHELESLLRECDERKARYEKMLVEIHAKFDRELQEIQKGKP